MTQFEDIRPKGVNFMFLHLMSENEQKKNLEEYFKRKLTHDEVFIVEWLYAGFEKELKKQKEQENQ
jgi:hypothetical protein